jgi:hypothetical protein
LLRLIVLRSYSRIQKLLNLARGMYPIAIVQETYSEPVSQKIGNLMADAFYSALAAFVIGFYLGGTMTEFDGGSLAGTVFLGAFVIFGVF